MSLDYIIQNKPIVKPHYVPEKKKELCDWCLESVEYVFIHSYKNNDLGHALSSYNLNICSDCENVLARCKKAVR